MKLADHPEERVRQEYLRILHHETGYSKDVLAREVPIYYGRKEMLDPEGTPVRADIVVYEDAAAKSSRDQGKIRLIVENKAPDEETGHNQLVSYIFNTSANGAVWYNGSESKYYRRISTPENKLIPWPGIPGPDENWDSVGRLRKSELREPRDLKGLFRRIHDRLHRRGAAGDDATLDMLRILIAKCRDEEKAGDTPEFYCTPEEYASSEGRSSAAERVERLFEEFRDANPLVFDQHERIGVGPDRIAEVVTELQDKKLVSDDVAQWDVMGAIYEEFTADQLKTAGGEFFTNRLVIALLVKMLDPGPDDFMLDPAGGTGGFCTATLRYMRHKIRESGRSLAIKQRLMKQAADRVFYIDIKHRLVKIAKTAMLLSGDGHRNCVQGDSLLPVSELNDEFLRQCRPGVLTTVLTNPPFAGLSNGRITDHEVLSQFDLGKKWEMQGGSYVPTDNISTLGTPPESLFLERCIEWLTPGGLLGIVQPKGVLDTTEPHLATRNLIFRKCKVLAVINCHKNTFQPHTGSRTCLLVLQKKEENLEEVSDYPIFMAISRKIGQDSQGVPIFKKDDQGNPTDKIDHDLDEISEAWRRFRRGALQESEYIFSVNKSDIHSSTLNINPQHHLPSLNESLKKVLEMDGLDGWSITTVGETAKKVYKGTRFKREDLETDVHGGPDTRAYYTPAALLQDRGESVKLLDLSRATESRKRDILKHELKKDQILITRSGTIGRVIYVTDIHDGQIGSDDLIRIEIADERLRYYIYGFLKTKLGQDQLKRNEYGTIQQHLEPRHIEALVIPVPEDQNLMRTLTKDIRNSIKAKEKSHRLETESLGKLEDLCNHT